MERKYKFYSLHTYAWDCNIGSAIHTRLERWLKKKLEKLDVTTGCLEALHTTRAANGLDMTQHSHMIGKHQA